MHRREFLKSTGLAAAAVTAAGSGAAAARDVTLATPAILSGKRTLTFGFSYSEAFAGVGDSAHRLAHAINHATGGQYDFQVMPESARGADLYFGSALDHAPKNRAFAFFAGLPGDLSLEASQLQQWLASGGDHAWDDLAADFGFKPLLAGHTGEAPLLWLNEYWQDAQDLEQRDVYAEGLAGEVITALGGTPALCALNAVKTRFATGGVAAAEMGGAVASFGFGMPAVSRAWTRSPFHQHGTALALEISKRVWDAMPASDRAAIKGAASEAYQTSIAEERAHRDGLLAAFAHQHGIREVALSPALRNAAVRIAEAVVAHAASETEVSRRINASYMAFRKFGAGA